MLDFYIIMDDQPKPNNPVQESLLYVGGLDDKTFENLKQKNIIDCRFYYYSDFRWGTNLIKQMQQTIKKNKLEMDNDIKALTALFDLADQKKSGLIAYGE